MMYSNALKREIPIMLEMILNFKPGVRHCEHEEMVDFAIEFVDEKSLDFEDIPSVQDWLLSEYYPNEYSIRSPNDEIPMINSVETMSPNDVNSISPVQNQMSPNDVNMINPVETINIDSNDGNSMNVEEMLRPGTRITIPRPSANDIKFNDMESVQAYLSHHNQNQQQTQVIQSNEDSEDVDVTTLDYTPTWNHYHHIESTSNAQNVTNFIIINSNGNASTGPIASTSVQVSTSSANYAIPSTSSSNYTMPSTSSVNYAIPSTSSAAANSRSTEESSTSSDAQQTVSDYKYKCLQCERQYKQKSSLLRHNKSHLPKGPGQETQTTTKKSPKKNQKKNGVAPV